MYTARIRASLSAVARIKSSISFPLLIAVHPALCRKFVSVCRSFECIIKRKGLEMQCISSGYNNEIKHQLCETKDMAYAFILV